MRALKSFFIKYKYLFLLISILILATFLRTIHLTSNPIALNQDEAVNGYDAYTLGKTLMDHHGNFLPPMLQSFDDWASPLLTYLTIPFVYVFGLSLKTIRMVVVLLGVGSIGLFYVFLRQISFKEKSALIGAFLLAIAPWHIIYSRWAIPPSSVCFFLLLFLVVFLWVVKKHQQWLYVFPGLVAIALTYSYPTQKLFVPLLIVALSVIYLRQHVKSAVILVVTYGLGVLPLFLLIFLQPEKYNASFNALSIIRTASPPLEFITRYIEYFLPYFHFQAGDLDIMHHVPGMGLSYDFLSLFFYLGLIICGLGFLRKIQIKNITQQTYLLLIAWAVLFPIAASLTTAHNMALRVVHGLPLVIVLFLLTIEHLQQSLEKRFMNLLVAAVVLLGFVNVFAFMNIYLYEYPKSSFKEFQYGIADYTSYLISHEDEFDKVIVDNSINKPYIYYLFYTQFDPSKLNYADPEVSSEKYVFSDLPEFDADDKNIIHEVRFGDSVLYKIFANERIWYVKKMY